jgi:hypothetical protein
MKTRNIIFYLIGLLVFSSCEDMFEPADENTRQIEDLTGESAYVHGLLIYAYDRMPYLTTTQTDVATDDAVTNVTNNYRTMALGTWQSDNNPMSQWDQCKDGVQYVNLFLSMVEKVSWAPSSASKQQMFIDRLKGEAFGLRALFYYYLLQAHGGLADDGKLYGVPLLTTPENGSSDYNQPRALFADCVKQCFADCDSAMALLPVTYENISTADAIPAKYRALGANVSNFNLVFGEKARNLLSGKVAEAIKAQVALLAASPAFREQSGVTSQQAALLCANVLKRIDWQIDPQGNIWYKNKAKLEPEGGEMLEILWREDRHKNADQESRNFPPTLYGKGEINPSQNLVDAFPMANGLPVTAANSGYDAKNPYADRDPRLSHYIIYNGAKFRNIDIVTGLYSNSKSEVKDNLGNVPASTRTGYYMSKLLREDVNPQSSNLVEQQHIYARIRYTEIFLAFAEAANDAWGPTGDGGTGHSAYDVIKAIRERAGIAPAEPGSTDRTDVYLEECKSDKDKMTSLIRNERRIELCFENKRFWDLRRWMLPLNEPVDGVEITKIDADKDPDPDNLVYRRFKVEDRVFDDSYQHYGPIPRGEILKWSNLTQNKGWE